MAGAWHLHSFTSFPYIYFLLLLQNKLFCLPYSQSSSQMLWEGLNSFYTLNTAARSRCLVVIHIFSSNNIWRLACLHCGKQLALKVLVLASKKLPKGHSAVGLAGIHCPAGGHSPLIGLSLSRICSGLYTEK